MRESTETLSQNLRRARIARGLSLDELSARVGGLVTKAALSKYELGRSTPRPAVLAALCKALHVRSSDLLEQDREPIAVRWLAYRKHSRLPARERQHIEALAMERAGAQLHLQRLLHPEQPRHAPAPEPTANPQEAESRADALREHWRLGDGPIPNLVSVVEDHGMVVVAGPSDPKFDALSGLANDGVAVIVINPSRPADRLRFSVAHELGHLAMDTRNLEPADEERMAHRFAAAFLVPEAAAKRELGVRRTNLSIQELEVLKQKYGMSIQAWIRRARDLDIVSEAAYRHWNIAIRSAGLHVQESVPYYGDERPRRMEWLCAQALQEGWVDAAWVEAHRPNTNVDAPRRSLVRELLAMPPEQRDEAIRRQVELTAPNYTEDSELREWREFGHDLDELEARAGEQGPSVGEQ